MKEENKNCRKRREISNVGGMVTPECVFVACASKTAIFNQFFCLVHCPSREPSRFQPILSDWGAVKLKRCHGWAKFRSKL